MAEGAPRRAHLVPAAARRAGDQQCLGTSAAAGGDGAQGLWRAAVLGRRSCPGRDPLGDRYGSPPRPSGAGGGAPRPRAIPPGEGLTTPLAGQVLPPARTLNPPA